MIELRKVTYRYPDAAEPALRDLSLRLREGELLLVTGSSGSGKSSLLRLFNGLIPHFHGGALRGEVEVFGLDPVELGPRGMSETVGFVHQDPEAHFVTRVVEDELAFAMENHGLGPATMRLRVEEVLDQLAIASLRNRDIETLSGGERQRVAIAAVLTLQPRLLVLDEPTSQLDPQSAEEVLRALRTLNDDLGLTLVIAEHRIERVAPYTDRVLILEADGSTRLGAPGDVLPASPLAPPLVQLCRSLSWTPATLTLKATRQRPEFRQLVESRRADLKEPEPEAEPTAELAQAKPAVEARGLWHAYANGVEGLRGLSLTVARGSLTALLGRNGAGKSTLLKTLVGLVEPDRGRVVLRPEARCTLHPRRKDLADVAREVGFVPQNPSRLLFKDSVAEELQWSLAQRGVVGRGGEEELQRLVEVLGLSGLEGRDPRELSSGERQRVALATAFAGNPAILLLDEPTRGLDLEIKVGLAAWLEELRDEGRTLLLATHDVELVARCADRVVLLAGGQVIAQGPTAEMLHGSPVFGTQMNRLFRDPAIHTLADVRRRFLDPSGDPLP